MKSKKFLLTALSAVCLFGCTSTPKAKDTKKSEKATADVYKDNANTQTVGALAGGDPDAVKNPNLSYTYSGKELSIPYYLENGFSSSETIGVVLFVDGVPQKYTTDDHKTAAFIQKWDLKAKEKKNMKLQFTPTVGASGDKLGIYIGTVFQPDFKPTEQKPSYGNNGDIQLDTPTPLHYTVKAPHMASYIKKDLVSNADYIPFGASTDGGTADMSMDWNLPDKQQSSLYIAKNSIYDVSFNMKGGSNCHYKVFAFVDNAPVKINGNDFLSVSMKENKMLTYKFQLDAHKFSDMAGLRMIAVPDGKYFMQDTANPSVSSPILLVNHDK